MDTKKEIVIPEDGSIASMDEIIEEVGGLKRTQILLARTNFSDRATHTKWRLRKEYPNTNFEVRTKNIEDQYYLKIIIL